MLVSGGQETVSVDEILKEVDKYDELGDMPNVSGLPVTRFVENPHPREMAGMERDESETALLRSAHNLLKRMRPTRRATLEQADALCCRLLKRHPSELVPEWWEAQPALSVDMDDLEAWIVEGEPKTATSVYAKAREMAGDETMLRRSAEKEQFVASIFPEVWAQVVHHGNAKKAA